MGYSEDPTRKNRTICAGQRLVAVDLKTWYLQRASRSARHSIQEEKWSGSGVAAAHPRTATVAPFPAWRDSQSRDCTTSGA
jgi:hypothetical protein